MSRAVVYTVEFQKRELPHAHILLFLSNEDKQPPPRRIDEIISAALPMQQLTLTILRALKNL